MANTPATKTERLVRALLLLATSAVLTVLAWFFGLYQTQDSTRVAIGILVIVIIAVVVSRLGVKFLMRRFGLK